MKIPWATIERYRVLLWLGAAMLSFLAGSVAAQTRDALRVGAKLAPHPGKAAVQLKSWSRIQPYVRAETSSGNSSLGYHVGPLTVEKQRNAFVSQVRVPVTSLFHGRVEIACVHQQWRTVNLHSAVPVADAASSLRVQPAGTIPMRTGASWGGGIWFQLGSPRI